MGRVGSCVNATSITIDPIAYDSINKRLNTNGAYCVYDSFLGECETNTVIYNTTAKKLVQYQEGIYEGGYCSNINAVSYNSTSKRLTYKATGSVGCW